MTNFQTIRDYKSNDKEELLQLVIASNLYQKQQLENEEVDLPKVKEETSRLFESILNQPDQQYLIAETAKGIAGFILVEVNAMYIGKGSIDDLFIISEYRNLGLGKQLVTSGVVWLQHKGVKEITLAVHKSNAIALSLYRECGFSEKPEEYVIMSRYL